MQICLKTQRQLLRTKKSALKHYNKNYTSNFVGLRKSKRNMSDIAVTISLPEMVDLALNSPEVGAVNFNVLHSLLHVIIRQVNLSDTKIQFNGFDGERVLNMLQQSADGTSLKEYMVMSEEKKPTKLRKRKSEKSSEDEGSADIGFKKVHNAEDGVESPLSEEARSKTTIIQSTFIQNETRVFFNKELNQLKEDIKSLKELPNNPDLIGALRPNNEGPLLEMYQILNLSKRMDASEIGLKKLASMLEDLAKEQFDCCFKLDCRLQATEESDKRSSEDSKLLDVEEKLKELADHVVLMDSSFRQQIKQLQDYLTDLEKEIGEIIEMKNSEGSVKEFPDSHLFNTVMEIQEEVLKLSKTIADLWDDKDHKQNNLDTLIEEIQLLKIVKADREDLEDALANKADTCAVNSKVSHDQFDAVCEDLSRAIQETLLKFQQQECMWQQALCDIQTEIENKLNKIEFMPLRDFVNSKIKMLQDRLQAIAALKKETEAAGTKSQYLRNVQCISCDNEVVMRKEFDPAMFPPPATLPPAQGMGPYLAYELDQLRSQRRINSGKNLNYHAEATKAGHSEKADHVCNRYCGGSHTITTPRQRVARVGHFLDQWASAMNPELDKGFVDKEEQQSKREKFMTIKSDILSERDSSKCESGHKVTSTRTITNMCETK